MYCRRFRSRRLASDCISKTNNCNMSSRYGSNTGGVRHKDYHSGTLEVIRLVNCSKNCSTDRKNLAVNRFFFWRVFLFFSRITLLKTTRICNERPQDNMTFCVKTRYFSKVLVIEDTTNIFFSVGTGWTPFSSHCLYFSVFKTWIKCQTWHGDAITLPKKITGKIIAIYL